jgi:carotenoid cleavage dioxygenase-like enzyme
MLASSSPIPIGRTPVSASRTRERRRTLHLDTGVVSIQQLDDRLCEFPRIDDRRVGRAHRYFHAAAKDPDAPGGVGIWNALLRYDLRTGAIVERRMGKTASGEVTFAPRTDAGGSDEDAGYLLTYAYDSESLETRFLILTAADIRGAPVATLRMPHRVPVGLLGSSLPGS